MSSTTTKTITKTKPKPTKTRSVTTVSVRKARPKRRTRSNRRNFGNDLPSCYLRCIEDPFNNPPCKLGFGTMVNSNLHSAYHRGLFNSNADGSIAILLNPAFGTSSGAECALHVANAGIGTATWTHTAWDNQTVLAPLFNQARPIAAALKVTPMIPDTSAPCVAYAGIISGMTSAQILALAPLAMIRYPALERGATRDFSAVRSRPTDMEVFNMKDQVKFNEQDVMMEMSHCLVILTGLPASSIVLVDAVFHFEALPVVVGTYNQNSDGNSVPREPSVSDSFNSIESFWRFVEPKLSPPGIIAGVTSILGAAHRYRNSVRLPPNLPPD